MDYLHMLLPKVRELAETHHIILQHHELDKDRRRKSITATDVPILMGTNVDSEGNPYETIQERFAQKLGRIPEFEGNADTEMGHYFEPLLVSKWLEREIPRLIENGEVITAIHFGYPLAVGHRMATVDAVIVGKDARILALCEAKKTRGYWGNAVPQKVYDQMTFQRWCAIAWNEDYQDIEQALSYMDSTGLVVLEDVDRNVPREDAILREVEKVIPYLLEQKIPPLHDDTPEEAAAKVKGKCPQVLMDEEQLALENELIALLDWQDEWEPTFKKTEARVKALKEELSSGLRLGVALKGSGTLYRTQSTAGGRCNMAKVEADLAAWIATQAVVTPEAYEAKRQQFIDLHTTRQIVTNSTRYERPKPQKEA